MIIMSKGPFWWTFIILLTGILLVFTSCTINNSEREGSTTPDNSQSEQKEESKDYIWGVDSASIVNEQLYSCILDNFGDPAYFGRYLETKDGVSYGLSQEEVDFLHENGVKLLPIYNHFINATTYEKGVAEAEQAISYAQKINIREGVYIFADIEPDYPVDKEFIRGWTETILDSPYKPGIYGVFVEESESKALDSYLSYVNENEEIKDELAVWTSDVSIGITTKKEAPKFNPEAKDVINVSIWQYGIDAEACNIDTNLLQAEFLEHLW